MQEIKLEISQENNGSQINDKKIFFDAFKFYILASIDLISALLVRLVFIAHILMAIIMVTFVHNDLWYMVKYKPPF